MENTNWNMLEGTVARLALAFLLFVMSQIAWAQQEAKAKDSPKSPTTSNLSAQATQQPALPSTRVGAATEKVPGEVSTQKESAKDKANGRQEGIRVHGRWTIEVHDPDGTLVNRREFENSLQSDGALTLAALISRAGSAGLWQIQLNYSVATGAPCVAQDVATGALTASSCFIVEPAWGVTNSDIFPNLSVSLGTGTNAGKVVLSGTATAGAAGGVTNVNTYLLNCTKTTAPNAPCGPSTAVPTAGQAAFDFTGVSLPSPIMVQLGQSIAVTVVISFS